MTVCPSLSKEAIWRNNHFPLMLGCHFPLKYFRTPDLSISPAAISFLALTPSFALFCLLTPFTSNTKIKMPKPVAFLKTFIFLKNCSSLVQPTTLVSRSCEFLHLLKCSDPETEFVSTILPFLLIIFQALHFLLLRKPTQHQVNQSNFSSLHGMTS